MNLQKNPIKITIEKLYQLDDGRIKLLPIGTQILNGTRIKNENQFATMLYNFGGLGIFRCKAFQYGRRGYINKYGVKIKPKNYRWQYWYGELKSNGFYRYPSLPNSEVERLQKELYHSADQEESEMILEEIELSKEIQREEKKYKRQSAYGLKRVRPDVLSNYESY